jgi:regulator of sigma E protease
VSRLFSILAPIVVFGIIVFVHELGHFLAAKLVGVYAPRFSIGFGPALFRRRRGETEYVLAALPLGGYVRMASREDEAVAFLEGGAEHAAEAVPTTGGNAAGKTIDDHAGAPHRGADWDPNAMMPFGPKPVPEHRWFESKSLLARLFILLAGVTMNIVLAYVINTGFALGRGRPYRPAVVDSVLAGRPAAAAGMRPGDSVVAVNGQPVRTWNDVLERVEPVTQGQVTLRVARRDGTAPRDLVISPVAERGPDPATGVPRTVGRIGVMARPTDRYEPLSGGQALAQGGRTTWLMASSVGATLRGLFAGDVSVKNLGGPIAIARTSVEVARAGWEPLLGLIALMSVNIAVLNLLPIPVLDGGQVLVNVLEAAKGSAFSARTREYILRAGLLAVAMLFVTVMWNDIARLVGDLVGR